MKNEITRKSVLTKAMEMDFSEEEKAVITKMIAQLDKRSANGGGVSAKTETERSADRARIEAFLAEGEQPTYTATEVANAVSMTVQKASARLKELVASGKVYNKPAKGKAKAQFSAYPIEDEAEGEAE